ncbi:hypothetical protein EON65_40315 [archaeon]|nr:MAG: hypothetical protein EON65_40315 [archaeon]
MELGFSSHYIRQWVVRTVSSSRAFSIGLKKYSPSTSSGHTSPSPSLSRSTVSALELLDGAKLTNGKKLNQSLQPKEKVKVNSETNGILEATALELVDDLNAALATPQLSSLFRSVPNILEVIEISKVILNKDMSHVDAFWVCKISSVFIQTLSKKDNITKQDVIVAKNMVQNINGKLQKQEARFRSHMIKSFDFRRVPRVFFRPDLKLQQQLGELEENRQEQEES